MSTLSSYIQSRDSAQATINTLTEQKGRLETARTSFQTELTDGFSVVQSSFSDFCNNLDEDNDTKDWEGQRVIDIRAYLEDNIEAKYSSLSSEYNVVTSEMTSKILELQNGIANATATRDYYQNLIDNYEEEEDEE